MLIGVNGCPPSTGNAMDGEPAAGFPALYCSLGPAQIGRYFLPAVDTRRECNLGFRFAPELRSVA
jgi:hypothetical protein